MATIYAMSDIHGYFDELVETLSLVNLESNLGNKLIFLGDYVNRGTKSCQVLYKIKELEEKYPGHVNILVGNHDQDFIDWLTGKDLISWFEQDPTLVTVKSFFTREQLDYVFKEIVELKNSYIKMSDLLKSEMNKSHKELLDWLTDKSSSLYYESQNQIFVHAGICEADKELWKYATEQYEFTSKFPAETGYFYKDIIAGHVSSVVVSENENYLGKIYWDTQSHFYIDGETAKSRVIPLLKYDTDTQIYSSYEVSGNGDWIEYPITKSKAR